MDQHKQDVKKSIEGYSFVKPQHKEFFYFQYINPQMSIDFQKIRQLYQTQVRDKQGEILVTNFEAKCCHKTFKLLWPVVIANNFNDVMDHLHFQEQEFKKKEIEKFTKFCQQEQSLEIRQEKIRELVLQSEVRKLELLEKIGFPIRRYKNYLQNQYQTSVNKNQEEDGQQKIINILKTSEEKAKNKTINFVSKQQNQKMQNKDDNIFKENKKEFTSLNELKKNKFQGTPRFDPSIQVTQDKISSDFNNLKREKSQVLQPSLFLDQPYNSKEDSFQNNYFTENPEVEKIPAQKKEEIEFSFMKDVLPGPKDSQDQLDNSQPSQSTIDRLLSKIDLEREQRIQKKIKEKMVGQNKQIANDQKINSKFQFQSPQTNLLNSGFFNEDQLLTTQKEKLTENYLDTTINDLLEQEKLIDKQIKLTQDSNDESTIFLNPTQPQSIQSEPIDMKQNLLLKPLKKYEEQGFMNLPLKIIQKSSSQKQEQEPISLEEKANKNKKLNVNNIWKIIDEDEDMQILKKRMEARKNLKK